MVYRLKKIQNLPISIKEAWNFFSNPNNLKEITPSYMGFKILEGADKDMFPGQIIKYIVKPLLKYESGLPGSSSIDLPQHLTAFSSSFKESYTFPRPK